MMSAVTQSPAYPAAMDHKLRQVCRRQLVLAMARAVLLAAAALLATMMAAMAIDWCFTLFSTTARTALTLSSLGTSALTLWYLAVGPIAASLGRKRAAGKVDLATPQLEERWTTVASFAEANHRPTSEIGRAMLRQVTSEAVTMGPLVKPALVATPRQLQRAVQWLAAIGVLLAALLAADWEQGRILLRRFWSPRSAITATQLDSVSGDVTVPRGDPVTLVVRQSGLSRATATLEIAGSDAPGETVQLIPSADMPWEFRYGLTAVESSFRYRVQAGDGRTRWYKVTALDRPALAQTTLTVTAPDYAARAPYHKDYLPPHIQAVQGSTLRLEFRPTAELKQFVLQIFPGPTQGSESTAASAATSLVLAADADGWYRYQTALDDDITLLPRLLSPHDLTNEDQHKCRIRVIPDRAPSARVISPTAEMAVRPDEVLDVTFEAHDDHGISRAELVIYEESSQAGEPPTILDVQEVPLDDQQNSPHVLATAQLELSQYQLRGGSHISFAIRVADNRTERREAESRQKSLMPVAARSENDQQINHDESSAANSKDVTPNQPADPARGAPQQPPEKAAASDTRSEPQPRTAPSDEPGGTPTADNKPTGHEAAAAEDSSAERSAAGQSPSSERHVANSSVARPDDVSGQTTESNRLRLTIEEQKISAGEVDTSRAATQFQIRKRLEQIDQELQPAEDVLASLVATISQSGIADPQIHELHKVDQRLAQVDQIIADLRSVSKETPYAFVGLHMVNIGTEQITPARDRIFRTIRQPDVEPHRNTVEALHRISRTRELLAELLVRFERVVREERLADSIEDTAKIYEVYVANLHQFLRAQTRPNPNPLARQMAIVEVDQDYLDRLRQVIEMRRDLMSEFARMLADDPRLLSKYMDILKRRQTSLRERLTELHERQQVIATELSGWRRVEGAQRDDFWILAAEARLQDLTPLTQQISQLEERTRSQFPLSLDPQAPGPSSVIRTIQETAVAARTTAAKSRRWLRDPTNDQLDVAADIQEIAYWLSELDASLDELAFRHPGDEIADYVTKRQAEVRTLLERVGGWTEMAAHLPSRHFVGLAKVDQQQLTARTELLRVEINGIDQQLANQFRGEVPPAVTELAQELKQLMETITFNQTAAAYALVAERLAEAESQQQRVLEAFRKAEELFDQIRRTVVDELDKIDPPNPTIAGLQDPTLDRLLEQLEREPDLTALLGLPDRPQNLRVISDFLTTLDGPMQAPLALEQAANQARMRAESDENPRRTRRDEQTDDDKSDEEWQQVADAEQAQEKLQAQIDELNRRAADPQADPEAAAKLRQMAEQLGRLKQQLAGQQIDQQEWEEMVRSDHMRAILRAATRGEPLPDNQWNRLMSTLDQGLWQTQRRTPPEGFRRAIEQYQDRIRKLIQQEPTDATR